MKNILGANWRTTATALGGTLMSGLTFLANVSYDQGPLSLVIPPEHKPTVTYVAGVAACILWAWNGFLQKDRAVTGGTLPNDPPALTVDEAEAASPPKP